MNDNFASCARSALDVVSFLRCLVPLVSLSLATTAVWSAQNPTGPAPFPTGHHPQLVRQFYTTADGLPGDDIRAVTVTRDGIVFASSGSGLARLDGERWAVDG